MTDTPVASYTVHAYPDSYGRWHARITFPAGAGTGPDGERLIRSAIDAARRTIRAEITARMAPEPVARLTYSITASQAYVGGALASLTLSESWSENDPEPGTELIQRPNNTAGAFR